MHINFCTGSGQESWLQKEWRFLWIVRAYMDIVSKNLNFSTDYTSNLDDSTVVGTLSVNFSDIYLG